MKNIDLYGIATYCVECFKRRKIQPRSSYIDTTFVAIDVNNNVTKSKTPHILRDTATQAILVHKWKEIAYTRWYCWYSIEFIDETGCVHSSSFDDNFRVHITNDGEFVNQCIFFKFHDTSLYTKRYEESLINTIWNLYIRCKECETLKEMALLCQLETKEGEIKELESDSSNKSYIALLLEQERDMYKSLLDEIQKIVEK